MRKMSNGATIIADDKKYSIESDAMVVIETKSGAVFEGVRVVGVNRMADGIRVISKDGLSEIPSKLIKNIKDFGEPDFPAVTVTKIK